MGLWAFLNIMAYPHPIRSALRKWDRIFLPVRGDILQICANVMSFGLAVLYLAAYDTINEFVSKFVKTIAGTIAQYHTGRLCIAETGRQVGPLPHPVPHPACRACIALSSSKCMVLPYAYYNTLLHACRAVNAWSRCTFTTKFCRVASV